MLFCSTTFVYLFLGTFMASTLDEANDFGEHLVDLANDLSPLFPQFLYILVNFHDPN